MEEHITVRYKSGDWIQQASIQGAIVLTETLVLVVVDEFDDRGELERL